MTKPTARRRRTPSPISLRLTQDEKDILKAAAKDTTISQYIRGRLFSFDADQIHSPKTSKRISPQERQKLLAQILTGLGQSNLARSLEELAEAAKLGVLPLSQDVLSEIKTACAQIHQIRNMLIKALGLKPKGSHYDHQGQSTRRGASPRQSFNERSRQ